MWGTEFIEDFWCAVHTVQNQFFDKFNLLTILKLDAKAFQNHIFWNFSQKPKCIKLMDDNLQGCRNKKRHDKKQGQRTNELEVESS